MRSYKESSHLYEGMDNSIIFIEGDNNRALNRFVERYCELIKDLIRFNGFKINKFNIIKASNDGEKAIKNLILRKHPTLSEEELQERVKEFETKSRNSRLLFINSTTPNGEEGYEAEIICEEQWEKRRYTHQFVRFLYMLIEIGKEKERQKFLAPGNDRYKLIEDEEDEFSITAREEKNEWLCNDLLADAICTNDDSIISPIHFDNEYNISLPLYPQITIELDPLPKSLYILFLIHPEGILLKEIQDYETELKSIYMTVSRRKNPTVINRMFRSIVNPTDNPLHKNISIIRRSFMSKLSYNIARNYIPPHSRNSAHNIPLDNSLVEIPMEILETSF